jgi:bacteriocin-like protein
LDSELSEEELQLIMGGNTYAQYAQAQHVIQQAGAAVSHAVDASVDWAARNASTFGAAGLAYLSRTVPHPVAQGLAAAGAVLLAASK